jgi:hypothetical protein
MILLNTMEVHKCLVCVETQRSTYISVRSPTWLAKFLPERKMFQTEVAENIGIRIYVHVAHTFSDIPLVDFHPQFHVLICVP